MSEIFNLVNALAGMLVLYLVSMFKGDSNHWYQYKHHTVVHFENLRGGNLPPPFVSCVTVLQKLAIHSNYVRRGLQ